MQKDGEAVELNIKHPDAKVTGRGGDVIIGTGHPAPDSEALPGDLIFKVGAHEVVRITGACDVVVAPHASVTDAARAFWDAVVAIRTNYEMGTLTFRRVPR